MDKMSKEKMIEEMVCLIDDYVDRVDVKHWYSDELDEGLAEAFYEADYRKQSKGEWERRVFIIFDSEKVGYRCSACNTTWDTPTAHCPGCGAKMSKGEGK